MSEPTLEKLNEAERICVDHLRQAQVQTRTCRGLARSAGHRCFADA